MPRAWEKLMVDQWSGTGTGLTCDGQCSPGPPDVQDGRGDWGRASEGAGKVRA